MWCCNAVSKQTTKNEILEHLMLMLRRNFIRTWFLEKKKRKKKEARLHVAPMTFDLTFLLFPTLIEWSLEQQQCEEVKSQNSFGEGRNIMWSTKKKVFHLKKEKWNRTSGYWYMLIHSKFLSKSFTSLTLGYTDMQFTNHRHLTTTCKPWFCFFCFFGGKAMWYCTFQRRGVGNVSCVCNDIIHAWRMCCLH